MVGVSVQRMLNVLKRFPTFLRGIEIGLVDRHVPQSKTRTQDPQDSTAKQNVKIQGPQDPTAK